MFNKIGFFLLLTISSFVFQSCSSDTVDSATGDWFKESDLDGLARHAAVGFTINNVGYLGLGADEDNYKLGDFWKYDPVKNTWNQIADFPGLPRTAAVAFSVGTKAYVGTGLDIEDNRLSDFWEYDSVTDKWTQIADFPGSGRRNAVSFTLGNKGYVGTGFDGNYSKDFYSFDPASGAWEKISSIGGSKRVGAASFVIDGKAYVGTGNNNGVSLNDLWKYDAAADLWTEMTNFDETTVARSYGVGFTAKGKGFFAGSSSTNTVWAYTPQTGADDEGGTWTEATNFEGTPRNYAVAWSIQDEGYLATGSSGLSRFDDLWKFIPDIVQDTN